VGLKTKPLFCMFSSAGMRTCGVSATAPQCGFGGGGPLLLNHFYWIRAIPDCQLGYQSLKGHSRVTCCPLMTTCWRRPPTHTHTHKTLAPP
jgi:hypothetical protein